MGILEGLLYAVLLTPVTKKQEMKALLEIQISYHDFLDQKVCKNRMELGYSFLTINTSCSLKAGIDEDPVTGSAHCVLGPYFATKLGKDSVVGKQMSRRGGIVECLVVDGSVQLTGTAITSMSGVLWI